MIHDCLPTCKHIHVSISHTYDSLCSQSDLSGLFFFFQDGENADFRHDDALYDSFPFDRLSMSQREIGEDVNSYIREYNL